MWMSLMTSGVKIGLRPSTSRRSGWLAPVLALTSGPVVSLIAFLLEHELALAGLEAVVVVELLPAHELLQLGRLPQVVGGELALDQLGVRVGPLAGDAVDPERGDLAAHVDGAVVHRVAQPRADVAADDLAPALHHEPGHGGGVADHDDHARHHVLGDRPADAAGDVDLGPVDQPAAEVAQAAHEADPAARQDGRAEGVAGAGGGEGDGPFTP